jgi:predicted ATPase
MIYLKSFNLLTEIEEHEIITLYEVRKIFNSTYPIGMFPLRDLEKITFNNITIFCGGNGSGKTTILNIISEKLKSIRKAKTDKGHIFHKYVEFCSYEMSLEEPAEIKTITSDDIFDYLLDIRSINANVNRYKDVLSNEYLVKKYNTKTNDIDNYEELKSTLDAKKKTMSSYIRERLTNNNIVEQSNGESALMFWEKEIKENAIYILDEPENSLSAENQLKLKKFLEDSARFFNCQFIISTHSPFILSLKDAKIYDLDSNPITNKKWTELDNIKTYYNFFKENEDKFENK